MTTRNEMNAPVGLKVNLKGSLEQPVTVDTTLEPGVYPGTIASAQLTKSTRGNDMVRVRASIDGKPNVLYNNITWHSEGSYRYVANFFHSAGIEEAELESDEGFDIPDALKRVQNVPIGVDVGRSLYQGKMRNTIRGFCRIDSVDELRSMRPSGSFPEQGYAPVSPQSPAWVLDEQDFE